MEVKLSVVLRAIIEAGATTDQIIAVVERAEAEGVSELQRFRKREAMRKARRRAAGADVPPEVRLAIFERDGWTCQECGSLDWLTLDHIHPVTKGGGSEPENLQTLCSTCNGRKGDRIRQQRHRTSRVMSREASVTTHDEDDWNSGLGSRPPSTASREGGVTEGRHANPLSPPKKGSPVTPSKEIPPSRPKPPEGPRVTNVTDDFPKSAFATWWLAYPHKVGKLTAEASFKRVRQGRKATFAQLMDALEAYKRDKPQDRPWCNPATWLNQGRWLDQPAGESAGDPGREDRIMARLKEAMGDGER